MTAAGHTPGPWMLHTTAKPGVAVEITGTGGRIGGTTDAGRIASVACIPEHWGNAQANARLIAAAPAMLEALKAVRAYIGDDVAWDNATEARILGLIDGALDIAEGRDG